MYILIYCKTDICAHGRIQAKNGHVAIQARRDVLLDRPVTAYRVVFVISGAHCSQLPSNVRQ